MDQLDETDAALVHALQIAPRAPWTLVGRALGVNPATAARRWQRLREAGIAWVTAYPALSVAGDLSAAFIEVDCESSVRHALAARLARDPRIASVETVGSGRDLLLTVIATHVQAMAVLMLDELGRIDGVRSTRLHLVTAFYGEGNRWRFGALGPDQQKCLGAASRPLRRVSTFPADARALVVALASDGRRPASELADIVGTSPSTVTRRVQTMVQGGVLSLRCEVANVVGGWPVTANYWGRVPVQFLERTAKLLTAMPEIRLCVGVTGATNLMLTAWLRSAADTLRLERQLVDRCPDLQLVDRAVTLRMSKRMGWLLDDHGRALECCPLDPWAASSLN